MKDLLGRMTLQEKWAQLKHQHNVPTRPDGEPDPKAFDKAYQQMSWGCIEAFGADHASYLKQMRAVQEYMLTKTRLGIPIIPVCEALHGPVQDGATVFPQHVALGSTFNLDLVRAFASANGREAYAMGARQVLAPCIDVARDLRWGRVEECVGEDPFLAARYAVEEIKGLQGSGVITCVKHLGAHGEPSGGLNLASVHCGERELMNVHLYPFRKAVEEAKPWSMMTSYDSWNDVPNSASRFLLTDLLRHQWGFKGYVYSDWGAVGMIRYFHRVAQTNDEAGVLALTSGLDLEASDNCFANLVALVNEGKLDEAVIDTACARVLTVKFAMGLFDKKMPTDKECARIVHSAEHVALSRKIADESIVLLKNDADVLPLQAGRLKNVALIGPNADRIQFGDYSWTRDNTYGITLRRALEQQYAGQFNIHYAEGCDITRLDSTGFAAAVDAARKSDVAIVVVGSAGASLARDYSNATSGEGFDLSDLNLTGYQSQLIKAVYRTGKPVVMVLLTGRPFVLSWEKEHLPSIVLQWYGGERQGEALADMLFGKTNPSGRLNYSFPKSAGNIPCYYNHLPSDRGFYNQPGSPEKPGRDYVLSAPGALWPFGYGLSYTSFEYNHAVTDKDNYAPTDTIRLTVNVSNTGSRDGKEVVQVYVRDVVSSVETPVRQLRAFEKVLLAKGESRDVELKIPVSELGLYNRQMQYVVEPGTFELQIGRASNDIRIKKGITVDRHLMTVFQAGATPATLSADVTDTRIRVRGTVVDVQGGPIVGATLLASGYTHKTDEKGAFSFECRSNDKIKVTASGYETQEIALGGRLQLNVRLINSRE